MILTVEQSLRQFCRLIFADRLVGDEVADLTLQNLGEEEKSNKNDAAKSDIFRSFLRYWSVIERSKQSPPNFSDNALLRSLGPLPSPMKLAVLLGDALQFTEEQIYVILQPIPETVSALLKQGRQKYAIKAKGNVVIVEDEAMIAANLRDIVSDLGACVVGIANTADLAVDLVAKHRPDLIITDYDLVGAKTGADAVAEAREIHDCAILFVTGFPSRVLTGSSIEPDVVIAKPYSENTIRAAAAQCLSTERVRITE